LKNSGVLPWIAKRWRNLALFCFYFYLIHNMKTLKNKYRKLSGVLYVTGTCLYN
jgi:hypothetical protein